MTRCLMIVIGVWLAGPAPAQEGPSFDCGAVDAQAEELVCADADLAALDRLVAERYAAAIAVVEGLDVGAEEAEQMLRATQRAWIGGRHECWKSDDFRSCINQAYQRREGELVARYMLEQPTGTAVWQCGDSPANELLSMFFDTVLPSVRIERGDTVSTGSLSRTASGSRFDGDFGELLWIRGDVAVYLEPAPEGTEHNCTLVE